MQINQLRQYLVEKSSRLQAALNLIEQSLITLLPVHAHPYIQSFILDLKKDCPDNIYTGSLLEHLVDDKLVDTFRNILHKVVSVSSKNVIITAIEKHFEKILVADLLNGTAEGSPPLVEQIIEYKKAQIQFIADIIGFAYAAHLNAKVSEIARNNPNAPLELIVLKRHEVCSNVTKGFGLFKDADLDATREDAYSQLPVLGMSQTIEDLYAAQQTQTSMLTWLKTFGHSVYVDMKVSPVSRAVSTAMCATFDISSHVNEIIFDSDMVEKQYAVKQICSGQASRKPSEWAHHIRENGFGGVVSFHNDVLIEGETKDAFEMRVNRATETILARNRQVLSNLRLNITVAHGDINKAIMAKIKLHPDLIHDIPVNLDKLSYGEQYILVGVRHPETKQLREVNYLGIYSRHGHRDYKEQVSPSFIKYFALHSQKERDEYITQHKDEMLEHLPFLLFRKTDELSGIDVLLSRLLREHLSEVTARFDNSRGTNYALNPSRPFFSRVQSAPNMGIALVKNTLTGKCPEPQQLLLEALEKCNTLDEMRDLRERALHEIAKGKVTNLIDAFIRKTEAYQTLPSAPVAHTPGI